MKYIVKIMSKKINLSSVRVIQPIPLLAIAWLLVTFTSCTDFLTEELQGDFNSETFYQNDKQALQAINGAYNAIAFTSFNNAIWVFGDVASDDAVKGGNPGDQAEITFIDEFNADANNGIINNYWIFAYEAISRANNVIAYVPEIPMKEELKTRIIGEARFLRAYSYFNLVNIFGKVPLKLLPQLSQTTIHVPLSEVSAIYHQIEEDLSYAVQVLPESYGSSELGRATRGSALGLLGKACLYQGKWAEAISYFQQLESSGQYGLLDDYASNFKVEFENSKESVFEVQHLTGQNPFTGNVLNQWFAPPGEGGYYFNAPTQALVDAFEISANGEADPRLDASIGRDGQPWLNGEPFSASWSPTGYLTKKHQQPLSEVPSSLKGDGDLNYIYMRYADILLMKAEAFNELGKTDSALINLNKVRKRARDSYQGTIPSDLLADITTINQNQIREAVRNERRVELAQEFHRFFDLMRWGKTVAEAALGPDFSYDQNRYQPLPQAEIDANQAIP
ncbi:MAG: RagB/SusD family nutrient uptake outer membrane protein [Bacteroidales bacterium]|jgi:tetratricopeptide (TPR) repeat protein|nr:RagB/SusD family nutrient uptake outer membrane protein [Bacteroidales bacterium]MDD3702444.1 RagB/SusD family nutrient uptake outer membrane protein [Bacteroidales bacterium]